MRKLTIKSPLNALLLAIFTYSSISTTAWSQVSYDLDDVDELDDTYLLDEILVTARRKTESIQAVPITIAAFNQNSLRALSINTTQDLQQAVSGTFLSGSGSRSNTLYSIRGQGQPTIGQGSPGVVTYFADVPLPKGANSVPQYDVGSVQILKGPQGTLFGRNTTGGAILTYPEAPDYDFGGYLKLGATDYSGSIIEGAANLPLIEDKLALRLAGQTQRRDGYTENIGAGKDQDDRDSESIRASILFEPNENIRNLTVIDYHRNDTTTSGAILIDAFAFPVSLTGVTNDPTGTPYPSGALFRFDTLLAEQNARGPRKVDLNTPDSREYFKQFGISNRTDLSFNHFDITNIMSYRTSELLTLSQVDGVGDVPVTDALGTAIALHPLRVIEGSQHEEIKQFTEELHVKGKALDDNLDWLLGAFFLKSEPDGIMATATGIFAPTVQTYQFTENKSRAIFANVNYNLLPSYVEDLKLSLGARKTWDEYTLCTGTGEAPGTDGATPAAITNCKVLTNMSQLGGKSNATTWTLSLDWKINEQLFAYLTTRKGYRSGGLNGPKLGAGLADFQSFDPEEIRDAEIGLRKNWQLADIKGHINLALFHSESSDVQVSATGVRPSASTSCTPATSIDGDCDTSNDPAQTALTINAGDIEVEGIDLALSAKVTPRLSFELTGTYQEHKTTSYQVPTLLSGFFKTNDIPVLYSPRKTATFKAQYTLPLDESIGELVFNANSYYSGETLLAAAAYVAPSYRISNARIDLNDAFDSNFDLSLFVRNIFDKATPISKGAVTATLPVTTVIYNEPRMWGVEAKYRFGGQ